MGDYRKRSVSFEGTVGVQQVVKYLEGLAAAIKAGTITLENGGESVSLHPSRTVTLSIEAKRKEDRERISLEIGWVREEDAVEPKLKIHDREPSPRDEFYDLDEDFEEEDDEEEDEDEDESDEEEEDDDEAAQMPCEIPADSMTIASGSSETEEADDEDRSKRKKKKKKKKK